MPVAVQNITDATQITAGDRHTCALQQTGTITCWGSNNSGQLGNGTTDSSSVPVEVQGITDATQITAGIEHTCALRQTGTITCWGRNIHGQLGNGQSGSGADSSVPVEVFGITDATQITAGGEHTCALRQTGTITCWGNNDDGQLGNGQSGYDADSSVPVEVLGITDATQITAGGYYATGHTCALLQTGTIACWGNNDDGQLGNGQRGDDADSSVPVGVTGISDATQITAGGSNACALRQTGTITCWGNSPSGEGESMLGINDATQITAGIENTCALRQTGIITCWGDNRYGQLGNGQAGYDADSLVPVEVTGITDATQITTGSNHSCALRQTGTITCWGSNGRGQLGNGQSGDDADSLVPVEVLGITDATQITAGGYYATGHTCALLQTGTITCWGRNSSGQLGNGQSGDDADSLVPVAVLNITDATQITASGAHTCALRQTGTITCWGDNRDGQLGNGQSGDNADSSVPVAVLNITDATQITASGAHTCALRQTRTITCWGGNAWGQLGNGQSGDDAHSAVPVAVLGITDATAITAGGGHTCALQQTGTITCWGSNEHGQLGNGQSGDNADSTVADSTVPVAVLNITDATQITTGSNHSCALRQTGTITCWGSNWAGQLGNGQSGYISTVPGAVLGITDATQITASSNHTCALRQTGTITCWGNNEDGQLGNFALPQNVIGFGG